MKRTPFGRVWGQFQLIGPVLGGCWCITADGRQEGVLSLPLGLSFSHLSPLCFLPNLLWIWSWLKWVSLLTCQPKPLWFRGVFVHFIGTRNWSEKSGSFYNIGDDQTQQHLDLPSINGKMLSGAGDEIFLERWSFRAKSLLWVMTSLELFWKSLENIIKNYTILDLNAFILPKNTKCFRI